MDLTAALLRAAAARPHVLVASMPGGTPVRLALERELRLRDLPVALTPADADILLVAGPACPELEAAVERLWQDMPAPRRRAHAEDPREVGRAVANARAGLARRESAESAGAHERAGGEAPRGRHSGGGGHGGGGDDMDSPAGLPMAGQGPDRDGLTLDRLHVSLGPFLPDWPHGLTVRLTLQGDVVQRAEVAAPPAGGGPAAASFWTQPWARATAGERVQAGEAARRRAAAHLDSLGRFLAVAGWPAAATSARRLRDDLLGGASRESVSPRAARLARRVGGSRTLYWLTRGLGPLSAREAAAAGVAGPAARADGDVPARYRLWLTTVREDVDRLEERDPLDPARHEPPRGPLPTPRTPSEALSPPRTPPAELPAPRTPSAALPAPAAPSVALAAVLPRLLEGAELAAARLIVASLDPDPDETAALTVGTAHE
ncbi:hypothetical protein [Nonomuraea wenchangensis]|uniref:Uncharacterized protein n=1 Tax=Nonomuraea wenchangensis TaxID=568860 RepID=A0A1I0LPT8_9ACTN|nr:hypothetical protein [Nonomuraea wenchangensis]SEU43779.1 hypothetical protein SAMN05421811_12246 [Nonomuraea wenchangensis]